MISKKKIEEATIYRIFHEKSMVFESTDKNAVTRELSRLNVEAVNEANEKDWPVEHRKKYDLRIGRDANKKTIKSPLLHDPWTIGNGRG